MINGSNIPVSCARTSVHVTGNHLSSREHYASRERALQGPTSGLGDGDGDGDFLDKFSGCWLSAISTCSSIMFGQPDNTDNVAAVLDVGLGLVLVLLVAVAERYRGDEAGELATAR